MIKAMILWLLGATFEVRLVSCKTGKDIPGRCLHKGGYWKACKVFKRRLGLKSKPGFILRLQATFLLQHDECPANLEEYLDFDTAQETMRANAPRRSNETQDEWLKRVSDILRKETQPIVEAHDIEASNAAINETSEWHAEKEEGWQEGVSDIAESNARQSEFMHEHQDEPNVSGPDSVDPEFQTLADVVGHECNLDGPLEFDKALGYVPTCTICEMKQ